MTTQTEAERMADYLDGDWPGNEVSAELRRLVSFNQQLMDEVARLNKEALHKLAAESLTEGLRLDDWPKIGCVNHDCDKCKAQQAPDYAWPTIADYEKEVGFEVNDAFRAAWTMARTTNDLFKQMGAAHDHTD